MKSTKGKKKIGSDTGKALDKPDPGSPTGSIYHNPVEIPLDNVIAEKDEVKNAEERLRQKNK